MRIIMGQRIVRIYVSRQKQMHVSKCDQAFNEGAVLPNLLRPQKWVPREAKDIPGFWIFPSCRPTAFLHEETAANHMNPKHLREPSRHHLCKDVVS